MISAIPQNATMTEEIVVEGPVIGIAFSLYNLICLQFHSLDGVSNFHFLRAKRAAFEKAEKCKQTAVNVNKQL